MRLAEIATLEAANRFLEITFWPFWNQRFVVVPARSGDAHRRLARSQRLEEILSVRVVRTLGSDHTVSWNGQRWGLRREQVCAGLRGERAEIEKRLDGTQAAFPRPLSAAAAVSGRTSKPKTYSKTKYLPPPNHPWRKSWKRTFLNCNKPDISTLR